MQPTPCVLVSLAIACLAGNSFAAQRVFVASYGSDSSACTPAAPCRSFARAIFEVDPGGEIVALDAAGYGAVTIGKSVTITTNPGYYAGISAATGNAITIDAPGAVVVLRGLNLNGIGALTGVNVLQAASLTMENCVLSNFASTGVQSLVGPLELIIGDTTIKKSGDGVFIGGNTRAALRRVRLGLNASSGLTLYATATGSPEATVTDSVAFGNLNGFFAEQYDGVARLSVRGSSATNNFYGIRGYGPGAFVAVGSSLVVGNTIGLANHNNATFESYGDNVVAHYEALHGTITLIGGQ